MSRALIPRDSKTLIEEFCTFISKFVPHVVSDEILLLMSRTIVMDLVRVALVIIFVADGAIFHIRWRSTEVDTLALRISRLKVTPTYSFPIWCQA